MIAKDNISSGNSPGRLFSLVYPLYFRLVQIPRESHAVIRLLFKFKVPKGSRVAWDFTDLVMRRAIKKYQPQHGSALEMGVGMGALLSNYLRSISGLAVDGVDLVEERVKSSQAVSDFNRPGSRIWQSDFYSKVEAKYDLVIHNPAYMPAGLTREVLTGLSDTGEKYWDGGADGASNISRFLTGTAEHLNPAGRALLGVNNFYVPEKTVTALIEGSPLKLVDRVGMLFNPSRVYVLQARGKSNG
jgi:methylase of polypeptide subunit release factors